MTDKEEEKVAVEEEVKKGKKDKANSNLTEAERELSRNSQSTVAYDTV